MSRSRTAPVTRRAFVRRSLAAAAAVAAPSVLPRGLLAGKAPSERIAVGMIGVGNHGSHRNLPYFLRQADARVAAVCDVYADRREKARETVDRHYGDKACLSIRDFREIIERRDIDAVMISTPDHWHVPMSILALRAGKDVICEKPTLTIREGRVLADLVRARGAVFQTSTEDRSMPCYHRMAQAVRNRAIGRVQTVRVELPAGDRFPDEEPAPVPEGLDWDLWLGPAPWAPFTPSRTEPQHWRNIRAYSGGKLTDWGMHQLDTVQWALDRESSGPVEVEGKGTLGDGKQYDAFIDYELRYRYDDGVVVEVRSGGTGLRFEGSEGWIGNPRFAADVEASSDAIRDYEPGPDGVRLFTQPAGEHRDFLDCVRSRKTPYFSAEAGHRCASLLHIGNIAIQLGRKLRWSPEKEEFVDDAEANALRSRPMREPWGTIL